MAKVLIATEKPFAPAAVAGIKEVIEKAGHELVLLEKYTEKKQEKTIQHMNIYRTGKITKAFLKI